MKTFSSDVAVLFSFLRARVSSAANLRDVFSPLDVHAHQSYLTFADVFEGKTSFPFRWTVSRIDGPSESSHQ